MKKRVVFFGLVFLVVFVINHIGAEDGWPVLKGPYMGQKPPGMTPEVFAHNVLAKSLNTVFSPDGKEFFFVRDIDGNDTDDIHWLKQIEGVWTKPVAAPFNSKYIDNDVCISHTGKKLFFRSWRPITGKTIKESPSHIWFSQKVNGNWQDPKPVQFQGNYLRAGYPSVAKKGNLYFPKGVNDKKNYKDLFYLKYRDGHFTQMVRLDNDPGNQFDEGDMCVAPDESFVITACWGRPDSHKGGRSDLYISFRLDKNRWSPLINMGKSINSEYIENCPTLSPDGKYFFFMRYDGKSSDAYWVSSKIIHRLKY
ncbi:MAG: hypothetical protein GY757_38085 [bacterium]|nr:hypothetical protein [bacterium]